MEITANTLMRREETMIRAIQDLREEKVKSAEILKMVLANMVIIVNSVTKTMTVKIITIDLNRADIEIEEMFAETSRMENAVMGNKANIFSLIIFLFYFFL